MAKKFTASSQQLKPDPKYHSKLVSKFINCLMLDGKKSTAQKVFNDAMDIMDKNIEDAGPLEIFEKAINNAKPMIAIVRELSLQFCLGYSVEEFAQTLAAIADGSIDVEPMITGRVGLDAVADAFNELAQPDRHAKILIDPSVL